MIGLSGQRLDLAPSLGLRVPKWLSLTQLELEVYTDNEPAIQLYKKFGFTIESTLAQFAFRVGNMSIATQWHDSDKWKAGVTGDSSDAVFDNFL
jgi:ribosomal protein S18 acetylase RimI-like enzyme